MQRHQAQYLLLGGQACVLYGAAGFSRDTDWVILASEENPERLTVAMQSLEAEVIAAPPFLLPHLEAAHAVHFRCRHPSVAGMRVAIMSRMRGVPDFETLWNRRTTLEMEVGIPMDWKRFVERETHRTRARFKTLNSSLAAAIPIRSFSSRRHRETRTFISWRSISRRFRAGS